MIEKEDVVISMTHFGYINACPPTNTAQRRGGKGVTAHRPKEEDFVENMFVTSTHSICCSLATRAKFIAQRLTKCPKRKNVKEGP